VKWYFFCYSSDTGLDSSDLWGIVTGVSFVADKGKVGSKASTIQIADKLAE